MNDDEATELSQRIADMLMETAADLLWGEFGRRLRDAAENLGDDYNTPDDYQAVSDELLAELSLILMPTDGEVH